MPTLSAVESVEEKKQYGFGAEISLELVEQWRKMTLANGVF